MIIENKDIVKKIKECKLEFIYKKARIELETLENRRNILGIKMDKVEVDLDDTTLNRRDCREFKLIYTIYDKNCWIKDLEKYVIEYKKLNQNGRLNWVKVNEC